MTGVPPGGPGTEGTLCVAGTWTSPLLEPRGDTAAAWVAGVLVDAGITADALYVATPDAGAREALTFWADARRTGPAFAAPGAFPWTLANSPAGKVSQALRITGPCLTVVGDAEALEEARTAAGDDVARGTALRPLVLQIGAADPCTPLTAGPVHLRMTAWTTEPTDVDPPIRPTQPHPAPSGGRHAME